MEKDKYNEYMKEYMLKRYTIRKAEAIKQLGGKCIKCGSTDRLEFDHIDSKTKSFTIGKTIVSISEVKLQEELKKCQLLCRKCHDEKSLVDKGQSKAKGQHGTISSYRYCKCDLCKEAKKKWTREYNQRKRSEKLVEGR